jgi:predicted DNA-binding protein (UPF0251 family)
MKARRVCCLPDNRMFVPVHKRGPHHDAIVLTVDEYEAFRLMDFMDMSQEECAKSMDVARTTVQKIYSDARKKIAEALVMSKAIKIEGGDYKLYSENERLNAPGRCFRHRGGPNGRRPGSI